ncbi:unnamed protein product [Microthlaspi erraticum]|uniref:F-box domain-containing protein n=1 Tax=Microthlaspi erraticum TaxID=1685480 RepID=A0A6D2L031_9BRAS|nr:unnamed protein product [Microthlaspi erraticum]
MKIITKLMHPIRRSLIEELPAEILTEILRKLPGKQELLCRSVSKTFLGLIDSRCFMERHLRDHDHGDEPSSLLTYGIHAETVFYKLWMCKTRLEESGEEKVLKVEDRSLWKYPCMQNQAYFNPISSNGLILIYGSSDPYVFNPIRKEAMKIPSLKDENAWKQPLGFGYDPKGNTHKIISVWETKELELVAKVFALRETDYEWRSLDISSSSSILP